jgi:hypothetical protein
VVWAFGVGTELQHAARHVNCAFDLAAGSQLRRVTNVDNDNIALAHPVSEIGGLNPRHGGIGSGQHILHTRRHGFTPVFLASYGVDRPRGRQTEAALLVSASIALCESQPEKSEATSDDEADPTHPHRYRPGSRCASRAVASDGRPLGEFYTASNKQKKDDMPNRWVGRLVVQALGCAEPRAKKLITEWMSDGKIVDFQYRSQARRKWLTGCGTPAKWTEIERAKAGAENVVLPFPPQQSKAEAVTAEEADAMYRFRSLDPVPPDTVCLQCGESGDVLRLRDTRQPGSKSETLHLKCAAVTR